MEFACKSFCAWIIDVHQRIVTQLLGGILTRYSTVKFWLGTDNDFIYLRFYYLGIYKGIFKQTERVYFKHKPFRKYLLFVFYFFCKWNDIPKAVNYQFLCLCYSIIVEQSRYWQSNHEAFDTSVNPSLCIICQISNREKSHLKLKLGRNH